MILKHEDLIKAIDSGKIHVNPFNSTRIGPNSIDVTLSDTLLVYDLDATEGILDCSKRNPTKQLTIPKEGLVLKPGTLYLGSTAEAIGSEWYVPMLEGRSSIGRLGLSIHITAGFGDVGFQSNWTLEITTVHPLRVYAGMRVGQVFFQELTGTGKPANLYKGKYVSQVGPKASELWKDFK